jgi:predicted  nucleic acid-binding Zn-ribbon protein
MAADRRRKERLERTSAHRQVDTKELKAKDEQVNELKRSLEKADKTKAKYEKEAIRLQSLIDAEVAKGKTMTTQMIQMADKQVSIHQRASDAEESLKKAQDEIIQLRKKVEMSAVFEQGLLEMRKLLEVEAAERSKLQDALEDLSRFQAKYKLTWLPDKSVTNCMLCREKFRMFGNSTSMMFTSLVASSSYLTFSY